ncbi:MAG: hypothetical protein KTR24_11245 [Saprospiraceae bacterium]|nr:hypothetical protein [Saprospiraceae bacterium]
MRVLLACLLVFLLSSCFAPEDKLTVGDLTLVDSFYRQERIQLELDLVDSCQAYRHAHIDAWIDSIWTERLEEIKYLIDQHER